MRLPRLGRRRRAPSDAELQQAVDAIFGDIGAQLEADHEMPELEPDHDWQTFDEMMMVFECASSEPIWTLIVAWSAQPIPGVRWHCDCGWHTGGPSWLNRPTHCGSAMKPESCVWLVDSFSQRARTIGVALSRTRP